MVQVVFVALEYFYIYTMDSEVFRPSHFVMSQPYAKMFQKYFVTSLTLHTMKAPFRHGIKNIKLFYLPFTILVYISQFLTFILRIT